MIHIRRWSYPDYSFKELPDLVRWGLHSRVKPVTAHRDDGRAYVDRFYGKKAASAAGSRWNSFVYDFATHRAKRGAVHGPTAACLEVSDGRSSSFFAGWNLRHDVTKAGPDRVLHAAKLMRWSRTDQAHHLDREALAEIAQPRWRVVKLFEGRAIAKERLQGTVILDGPLTVFGSLLVPSGSSISTEYPLTTFGRLGVYRHPDVRSGRSGLPYTGGSLHGHGTHLTCGSIYWPGLILRCAIFSLGRIEVRGSIDTKAGIVCGDDVVVGHQLIATAGIVAGGSVLVGEVANNDGGNDDHSSGCCRASGGPIEVGNSLSARRVRIGLGLKALGSVRSYGCGDDDGIDVGCYLTVGETLVSSRWIRAGYGIKADSITAGDSVVAGYGIAAKTLTAKKIFAGVDPVDRPPGVGLDPDDTDSKYMVNVDNVDGVVVCGSVKPQPKVVSTRTIITGGFDG